MVYLPLFNLLQRGMISTMIQPAPYKGSEPYIFISYSHKDNNRIAGILNLLADGGYRFWFDEGIDPGTEWDQNIAAHIKGCSYFIAFLSSAYLASSNCCDELNFARDENKERLLIYLEEVELPDGMKMRLNRLQAIHWYRYGSNTEKAFSQLCSAPGLSHCRTIEPQLAPAESSNGTIAAVPPKPETKKRAWLLPAGCSIVAAILILVAVLSLKGCRAEPVDAVVAEKSTDSMEEMTTAEIAVSNAETETVQDLSVPADPAKQLLRLTLTADDEDGWSIAGFNSAAAAVAERLRILTDNDALAVDVSDNVITADIPAACMQGYDATDICRALLSRSTNLYISNTAMDSDCTCEVPRAAIASVELVEGIPEGINLQDCGEVDEGCRFLKITLSKAFRTEHAELLATLESDLRFWQDIENTVRYFWYSFPCGAEGEYYLLCDYAGDSFASVLMYNLTHEPLEHGLYIRTSRDINAFIDWLDPTDSRLAGENQCGFGQLQGETVTLCYATYSDDLSGGDLLDAKTGLLERFDALGKPYAAGFLSEDDRTFCFCLESGAINSTTAKLFGEMSVSLSLTNGTIYESIYDSSLKSIDIETDETGACSVVLSVSDYKAVDVTEYITAVGTPMPVFLSIGTGKLTDVLFMLAEAPEEGKLVFTQLPDGNPITEDDLLPVQLLNVMLSGTDLPSSFHYTAQLNTADGISDITNNLVGNTYEKAAQDALLSQLEVKFSDYSFYFDDTDLWCELHLPVDDELPDAALSAMKEVYESIALPSLGVSGCTFVLIDETAQERGRVWVSWYTGIRSSEPGAYGPSLSACVRSGRMEAFQETIYSRLQSDEFFNTLIGNYSSFIASED